MRLIKVDNGYGLQDTNNGGSVVRLTTAEAKAIHQRKTDKKYLSSVYEHYFG